MKQNEYFLVRLQVSSLHHRTIAVNSDAWRVELKEVANRLGNFLAVSIPHEPQRLGQTPTHILKDESRIHVVWGVVCRNVNGAAIASELVDRP
jgi:hypothetical protein